MKPPCQWLVLFLLLWLPSPSWAEETLSDLRKSANHWQQQGQWERAAEAYLKILLIDRQPEIRERLHECLRQLNIDRRHRDSAFREKVLSLPIGSALNLYSEVLQNLQGRYVDRDKVAVSRLFTAGVEELGFALNSKTFRQFHLTQVSLGEVDKFRSTLAEWKSKEPKDLNEARRLTRELAHSAHRTLGLKVTVAILELACGACASLDEYSAYLTPSQLAEESLSLAEQQLNGLGITLGFQQEKLHLARVLPGSWAYLAGLRDGDRVVRVGRKSVEAMTTVQIIEYLRGEKEPLSELEVAATADLPSRSVKLPLSAPSVAESKVIEGDIGYVKLLSFEATTAQELESALLGLRMRGIRVLILDLRGNPGGLFQAAVRVTERFLTGGTIVQAIGPTGQRFYNSQSGAMALDIPLVLLVDAETASSAEVVAAALKDNQRATLVGQTTFGKGCVQCLIQLQSGGPSTGAVRVTLAKFLSPRGKSWDGVGVAPHLQEVGKDRQLELALEQARILAMR